MKQNQPWRWNYAKFKRAFKTSRSFSSSSRFSHLKKFLIASFASLILHIIFQRIWTRWKVSNIKSVRENKTFHYDSHQTYVRGAIEVVNGMIKFFQCARKAGRKISFQAGEENHNSYTDWLFTFLFAEHWAFYFVESRKPIKPSC